MGGGYIYASILQTKIARPPVRNIVRRPRLYELLDSGAQRKLTIVSAPAGYGKTTLVASWLGERSLDCCWVNLDRLDGSAQQVTTYIGAALDRLEERQNALRSNRWTELLNALAARRRETIVILDDYHLAESAEVNDLVMLLIERLPPASHLVIVTRADPALRVARLRGQGELVEIRQSDLALTIEEIEAFLKEVSGIELAKKAAQSLHRATEGWVAGLQILTSSLKDGADPSRLVGEPGNRQRYLRDYLVEEVLAGLDPPTLEFLERCSILERLSAELCDAVTGRRDSRELLASMDRQHLFVSSQDEERRWFGMHHLFAELLSARLQDERADELPALHRVAAQWFAAHDQPLEAIDHRLAAGDMETAAELINERAEWLLKQGELMVAKKWIDSLPDEICAKHPAIALLRVWSGIEEGQPLVKIERELDSIGGAPWYEAQVLCIRSYLAGLQGKNGQALELSEKASRMTDGQDLFVRGHAKFRVAVARLASGDVGEAIELLESAAEESLQAGNLLMTVTALAHKARAMVSRGDIDGGERTYQRALDLAMRPGGSRSGYVAWALIGLGEVNRLRGNIEGALELFGEGMETLANWPDLNAFSTGLSVAHALLAKGRAADALEALRSAEELARRSTIPLYFSRLVEAHRTLILLRCGRLRDARACMKELSPRDDPSADDSYVEGMVSDLEILAQARLALLEKKPRECIDLAIPAAARARNQKRELHALNADILMVQAHWQMEEIDEALPILERGLSFASERGIAQPFIDEGPELARILYRARALGLNDPFIRELLAAFPLDQQSGAAAETQPPSVESLTAREVEVLTLLSQGLSNKEAAAALFLSVRTVKWYTSNIYAKLAVSSRTQAIAKARRLGILPE
jgi:LuxR family maltose regulon positive regulatory protein